MASDTVASIVAFQQPTRAKRNGQRATGRQRRRKADTPVAPDNNDAAQVRGVVSAAEADTLIPAEFSQLDSAPAEQPVAPPRAAATMLVVAALVLAGVGITINGWFARSLGSSDIAGWLFLATGVAADLVALAMPSCALALWQSRRRASSLAAWAVWAMTFIFAMTAGVGFASINIADVATARAAHVTPAVAAARAGLNDAMAARDRECVNGVGKFCREREGVVAERRQILDTAMATVAHTADPQTDAAIKLVAWLTRDWVRPSDNDFAMLRLSLLALLPQIGGILLMLSRSAMRPATDQLSSQTYSNFGLPSRLWR